MLSKLILVLSLFMTVSSFADSTTITVGSKRFAENLFLAETLAILLEENGYRVNRRFNMGGTLTAHLALQTEELDVYPEYSGTAAQAILKSNERDYNKINSLLKKEGVELLKPFGFNNSYVLIMKKSRAQEMGIKTIGDLSQHPNFLAGMSFEFHQRKDGWYPLSRTYNLKNKVTNIDVPLVYQALDNDKIDFAEAYSSEPLIDAMNFVILDDTKKFFPTYLAAPMVHKNVSAEVREIMNRLAGTMSDSKIRQITQSLNNGTPIPQAAHNFLVEKNLIKGEKIVLSRGIQWSRLLEQTKTHLYLTLLAVFMACLVAIPLGSIIASYKTLSSYVLGFTGILQTIPSIALLTFMIPFFGIGFKPAIVGLFVYSLLPIVRNTYTAMNGIDPNLVLAARGIGLYPGETFWTVKFPLAFPTILAGVRTATTLNIGTATLAAFIGAGGLGVPIVTGLALNDTEKVLQGAIPAALLAIVVDFLFGFLDKFFTKEV